MNDFNSITTGATMVHSAGASLSMADANFDGVKHHDIDKVDSSNKTLTWVVSIAAASGVAMALTAMWVEASMIAFIAFAFPLVTAPYVVLQRRKIQWLPTFKEEANKLRVTVIDMAMERNRLASENGRMERQIGRMSAVEERFEQVVRREGKDISQMRQIVRENGAIQQEIKKLQAARDLQDLFSVILRCDKKLDNVISEEDLNRFVLRVKDFFGRKGKKFNEEALREAFKSSMTKSNMSLFRITTDLLGEEEQKIDIEAPARAPAVDPPAEQEMVRMLRKVPSSQQAAAAEPEMLQRLHKVPSSSAPQQAAAAEPEVINLTQVPTVLSSTGLVVPNTEIINSDGQAPYSIYGARVVDPAGIKSIDDTMLDGLLSSNSMDYDAASTKNGGSTDAEGFFGFILQTFSGDNKKAPEPQNDVIMNNV